MRIVRRDDEALTRSKVIRVEEAPVRRDVHASSDRWWWLRSLSDAKSELAKSFAIMQ